MRTLLALALAGVMGAATAAGADASVASGPTAEVVLAAEVEWEALNPARGDKSPQAATLWGDRKGAEPTGFLVKFVDGFESPPHIHNVSYRGVVISGLIHNDDPDAADMWMPPGSFWTQPRGEGHITAARGRTNIAYIEIESGPYLVLPTEKAFDSGERPVNVDKSNLVWLDASDITWVDQPGTSASANGPKIAFLWGDTHDDELNGTFIKLPAGFAGEIRSHGSTFRAVVIKGQPQYRAGKSDAKPLGPGSYFSSEGASVRQVSSSTEEESILYVRANGKYDILPTQAGQ